jgi:hypothetical protein
VGALSIVRRLPSTAETEEGPLLTHRPGEVEIRYDLEGDAGIVWVTLRFVMAFAVRFTPDAACTEMMIKAYSKICELTDSEWLRELRERGQSHGLVVSASLRHFVVYLDHYGCFEVVADDVAVEGEQSVASS